MTLIQPLPVDARMQSNPRFRQWIAPCAESGFVPPQLEPCPLPASREGNKQRGIRSCLATCRAGIQDLYRDAWQKGRVPNRTPTRTRCRRQLREWIPRPRKCSRVYCSNRPDGCQVARRARDHSVATLHVRAVAMMTSQLRNARGLPRFEWRGHLGCKLRGA